MRKDILAATLVLLAGAGLTHLFQRQVDAARFARRAEEQTLYQPDGEALRVAAMGYHGLVADIMWVRAVLQFADVYEQPSAEEAQWLKATLRALSVLDPGWRTLYFYGGGFLRVAGDIEGSDELYRMGHEVLPDDPFFPFSLGMNAYLYRDDTAEAARWLQMAAGMPGAPPWYHAAAASFMEGEGQRRQALHYLDEQIEKETRPSALEALKKKRAMLIHDELAARIEEGRRAWEARTGEALQDLGALGPLPPDPLGGEWILAPDGAVRSSIEDARRGREARMKERAMLLRPKAGRSFPLSPGL